MVTHGLLHGTSVGKLFATSVGKLFATSHGTAVAKDEPRWLLAPVSGLVWEEVTPASQPVWVDKTERTESVPQRSQL